MNKRTKIVATIGPSSEDKLTLKKMITAGMNVARLNFSHGSFENHQMLINNIREVAANLKTPVAILQDLQGPKIRVGKLAAPIPLKKNQTITIGEDFLMDFDISNSVKPGEPILIEDGLIELQVVSVTHSKTGKPGKIKCKVVNPGIIKDHKGINLPQSKINFAIMTKKDVADLQFGLKAGVDYVALSFVRNASDIINIKKLVEKHLPKGRLAPKVIAKIERGEAVEEFDKILEETDGVMVARGDLGVEIPDSKVPLVQKEIIAKCVRAAKPVIVATQMLDSMIRNPRPTRAEVSDVANAVIDHADAVMLSGESAYGSYPVEAVTEMAKIIADTEKSPFDDSLTPMFKGGLEETKASLIAHAVNHLALGIDAKAIIGTSESGYTARFIARERPNMPVLIMTDEASVYRQMALNWGVDPYYVDSLKALKNVEGLLKHFIAVAKKAKVVQKGDKAVLVAGNPLGQRMNLVQAVNI